MPWTVRGSPAPALLDCQAALTAHGDPYPDSRSFPVATTITKTVFTVTVLHRTDDADRLAGQHNFETAWSEAQDGNAVGDVTSASSTELMTSEVAVELMELGNDGTFFNSDLGLDDEDQ
jgi:hypothetical protein